ncbi:MAG: TolC family protein [Paucibacter sp.]|nr:TolC family protein [Roseateles sp.]
MSTNKSQRPKTARDGRFYKGNLVSLRLRKCLTPCLMAAALAGLLVPSVDAQAQAKAKPGATRKLAPAEPASERPANNSQSRCGEEDALPSSSGRAASMFDTAATDPRTQLQELVQTALRRSQATGSANLLAQAARDDWEEARAARIPQVDIGGSAAYIGNKPEAYALQHGLQGRLTLNVAAPLYSSGRIEQLAAWRSQLAESARQGLINTEQQIALQVVSLAMDRGRYQLQAQVFGQYVRKMACLAEALDIVVRADKGRASELVQAQKTLQQTELALTQTKSTLKQVEIRLRRFVGDELPPSASYSTVLTKVPELEQMQADVLMAADVVQLAAQARAQLSYADSVAAAQKPQINLLLQSSATAGQSKGGEWAAGVSFNVPIFNAGADYGIGAARKRAESARLMREDTIEARRYRVADMHEAATSSFERARNIVDILRNSDRLRASTLQQWQQLGRRSLFDVMGTEADYFSQRIAQVNALYDGQQAVALLWSMGKGVMEPLR